MDDAVYCPGMWKQILVWHLVILFLRVIVIQSKLRSHKSRDTWKSKAKARRQSHPCLHPHHLSPFAFHAMQCNARAVCQKRNSIYVPCHGPSRSLGPSILSKHCHCCHMRPITGWRFLIYLLL